MYFKADMESSTVLFKDPIKWIFLFTFLVVVGLPFPAFFSNTSMILLLISWFLWYIKSPKLSRPVITKEQKLLIGLFYALFFWQALSLFYNTNLSNGLKGIEGKLTLLIAPLVLLTIRISKERLIYLFKAYILVITLVSCFLLLNLLFIYASTGELIVYHDFTAVLELHAVFFSYYIFLNVLLISYLYSSEVTGKKLRLFYFLSILLSIIVLVIAASKNVLVVTLASIFLSYLHSYKHRGIKWKEVVILLVSFLVVATLVLQTDTIKSRINELTELRGIEGFTKVKDGVFLQESDIINFNGTSLRITLWYLGVKVVKEEGKILQGLTAGDRRDVMNNAYDQTGLNPWYKDYNLHNQFVQTFVELGLIGLCIYLVLIISLFVISIKERNWLLTIFLAAFIFFQITESVLERNKGIVFFIFIILLLMQIKPRINENRNIRN